MTEIQLQVIEIARQLENMTGISSSLRFAEPAPLLSTSRTFTKRWIRCGPSEPRLFYSIKTRQSWLWIRKTRSSCGATSRIMRTRKTLSFIAVHHFTSSCGYVRPGPWPRKKPILAITAHWSVCLQTTPVLTSLRSKSMPYGLTLLLRTMHIGKNKSRGWPIFCTLLSREILKSGTSKAWISSPVSSCCV